MSRHAETHAQVVQHRLGHGAASSMVAQMPALVQLLRGTRRCMEAQKMTARSRVVRWICRARIRSSAASLRRYHGSLLNAGGLGGACRMQMQDHHILGRPPEAMRALECPTGSDGGWTRGWGESYSRARVDARQD